MFAVKKRNIIICLILACLLCIAGLFFVGKDKNADVTASAATSEDVDSIYFTEGAQLLIQDESHRNMYRMAFVLNVSTSYSDKTVDVFLPFEFFREGIYLITEDGSIMANNNVMEIPVSGFSPSSSGWLSKRIVLDVGVNPTCDIYITATLNLFPAVKATSAQRNWIYIYNQLKNNNQLQEGMIHRVATQREIFESSNSFDSTRLEIGGNFWLDQNQGVRFFYNIPSSYMDAINSDPVVIREEWKLNFKYGILWYRCEEKETASYRVGLYKKNGSDNDTLIKKLEKNGESAFALPADESGEYYLAYERIVEYYYSKPENSYIEYEGVRIERLDVSSTVTLNKKVRALEILSDSTINDGYRAWLQQVAGEVPSTDEINVILRYKTLNGSDVSTITEKTETFLLLSLYAQAPGSAINTMYSLKKFANISDFNVILQGSYCDSKYQYRTDERVFLQADYLTYNYDAASETGYIEVIYKDFQYKDLRVRIKNNDPENRLEMDFYTANVVEQNGIIALIYNYADIQEKISNQAGWIFDLSEENFTINGISDKVTVAQDSQKLTVSVPQEHENELATLSMVAIANIQENTEHTVRLQYKTVYLNEKNNIIEETVTGDDFKLYWREIFQVYNNFDNFIKDFDSVVTPQKIQGSVEYAVPSGVRIVESENGGELEYDFIVEYKYNSVFKITNSYSGDILYKQLNDNSLIYKGDFFVETLPNGYRVKKIVSDSSLIAIENNPENYINIQVKVLGDANDGSVYLLHVELSDLWPIKINYLETWKDTCFALRKETVKEIRVKNYDNVYALTISDLKKILGKSSLDVCKMVSPDELTAEKVCFDEQTETYIITLAYGHASLKQIDYDGNSLEIQVPLTSYVDWCNQYGSNWSILFLNTENKRYFTRSNEVDREDLYGFFSVAVFSEQVSDFNYYFKNNTGAGCMTIFNKKEVVGSSIYKWFGGLTGGVMMSALGYVGMAFCEVANDNNQILHSYFFYLDGSDPNAYLSNGGADNAFDTDSSTGNFIEDVGETLGEWMSDLKNAWDESPIRKLLTICSFILIGSTTAFAIIWLKRKFKIKKKARTSKKKSAPANKTKTKTAPAKETKK